MYLDTGEELAAGTALDNYASFEAVQVASQRLWAPWQFPVSAAWRGGAFVGTRAYPVCLADIARWTAPATSQCGLWVHRARAWARPARAPCSGRVWMGCCCLAPDPSIPRRSLSRRAYICAVLWLAGQVQSWLLGVRGVSWNGAFCLLNASQHLLAVACRLMLVCS